MIYHSRDFFSLLYRASIKALYDSKVKSFEMKNESFLMKEKTKINIANKILSLCVCPGVEFDFLRYPLYSWKFAFIRITNIISKPPLDLAFKCILTYFKEEVHFLSI